MKAMDNLVDIVVRLREGCPWDREQTHKSVRGHLVEECAELLEAIDSDDSAGMREELGDILMHLVLHARIAEEQGRFTFEDVVSELCEKLVRRHPHVFGDESAKNSDEVLKIWNKVKIAENKPRAKGGLFDGIPPALSALRLARDVAKKAEKSLLDRAEKEADGSLEMGKILFEAVRKCVEKGVEPEGALRDYISEIRKLSAGK